MKVEISHDTLAKSIYDKASSETKLRLKIKSFVIERYNYFLETKVYLSSNDLDYINPYLEYLNRILDKEELLFIKKSRNRRQYKTYGVFGVVTVCGMIAFIVSTAWGIRERNSKNIIGAMNLELDSTIITLRKKNDAIDSLFKTLGKKDDELSLTAEELLKRNEEAKIAAQQLDELNKKLTITNSKLETALADLKKEKEKLEKDKVGLQKESTELKTKITNTTTANDNALKKTNEKLLSIIDLYEREKVNEAKKQSARVVLDILDKEPNNQNAQNILRQMYKNEKGMPEFNIPPLKNIKDEMEKKFK